MRFILTLPNLPFSSRPSAKYVFKSIFPSPVEQCIRATIDAQGGCASLNIGILISFTTLGILAALTAKMMKERRENADLSANRVKNNLSSESVTFASSREEQHLLSISSGDQLQQRIIINARLLSTLRTLRKARYRSSLSSYK